VFDGVVFVRIATVRLDKKLLLSHRRCLHRSPCWSWYHLTVDSLVVKALTAGFGGLVPTDRNHAMSLLGSPHLSQLADWGVTDIFVIASDTKNTKNVLIAVNTVRLHV
jgi:hypothetical protein